ncbi:Nitrite reductase (NAD(P)H), small subunit [Microbacterium sp. C448]|uniref:nitrite reductase small subunit NirD n=1 Tax=Microbacterium TaxID=33882 RepID=UPI0003DE4D85|nr:MULTISPECIES: nitrite reductase small subunit NirD [Microbacterium]CDK00974.1 Nitrite reductase (NAD(P)H), small subunit [Microbacterium sp. C448]|tara:strand:- start:8457 stop:8840 length:384 start_codon:yes stop_codon:yes gene_type:complete
MTIAETRPVEVSAPTGWKRICPLDALEPERGRAALVGMTQVALFLLHDGEIYAVSNHDPYSGAHVMSRGIVGTRGGVPTVASPMYKQVFDLRTGICLDTQGKDERVLDVWPAQVRDGELFLKMEAGR